MERITDKYVFFWGSVFSNWHMCKFEYKGHWFDNSEQAFMWEKAMFFKDIEIAEQILQVPYPKTCKELGREVKNFDYKKWNDVSLEFMIEVNKSKFDQNEKLKDLLSSTGDKIIVEASPSDSIWGIGLHWSDDRCLDESQWQGENRLGKALVEVRKSLK